MVTYQNAVDTYPNCKKVILQADYQPMNNNVETFTSSSKSMGRKSQLQSRLKNPIHFQERKEKYTRTDAKSWYRTTKPP